MTRANRDLPPVACVTRPVPHQVKAMSSIATALRRHGLVVRETYDRVPSESIVFAWSWKWCKEILERHPTTIVCTLDHGLLHPRNETVVTGWMGLNGLGEHPVVVDGGDRLRAKGWDSKIQPARKVGQVALVLGQCYNDVQILDHLEDYGEFLRNQGEALRSAGYEVYFRPHPVQRRNDLDRYPRFAPITEGRTLQDDLERYPVGCVAAFNSNGLLDCFMAGVKDVWLHNHGSMLYPIGVPQMSRSHLEADWDRRVALAQRLAYCQWTPQEIAEGDLWAELHIPIMRRLIDQTPRSLRPWYKTEVPK